jgi:two-component system chemotaxis response regulator CheB
MSIRNTAHDIIVIGGSAGALGPLVQIAAALPEDFPAAVFVVIHTPADSPGLLPIIVGKSCALKVRHAAHGDPIVPGRLYVAPPDRHLLLATDHMKVLRGPRENRSRPSIDPLFRTAARMFGPRVIGVVLSGVLNDGTYGLMAVKQGGGVAIVQDPEEADYPDMPASVIGDVDVDHVLPAIEIANLLNQLVLQPVPEVIPMQREKHPGADRVEAPRNDTLDDPPPGALAPFVCPDCGGALWETNAGKLTRYRCHVGHAFTADILLSGQQEELESALWAALRTLEENVELSQRLAKRASEDGHTRTAQQHQEHANEMEQRAELVQRLLRTGT